MTVWVIDYDLPADNRRRKFYRHVAAWLRDRNPGGSTSWSTQSVIFTEDEEFARFVFAEASQLGRARLWKAEKIAETET